MGIFVSELGDIVTTHPGYAGVKLIAFSDDVLNRDRAEQIARRLRELFDTTDTVWLVKTRIERISPVFHCAHDARVWLWQTKHVRHPIPNEYQIIERAGNDLDVTYTTA